MFKKSLTNLPAFTAGDLTIIREVAHPKNDGAAVSPHYSLAFAELSVGAASLPHVLKNSSELYVFTAGEGRVHIGEEAEILRGGETTLVPAGATQWVENIGTETLQFYVIVSPPWAENEEEVL